MTNQETLKQEEEYFDNLNYARRNTSVIYPEIDCRSNDIYLPSDPSIPPCDPIVSKVFNKLQRRAMKVMSTNKGNSLDVCCGPGWLTLESARLGYTANGVDLSKEGIEMARQYLQTQPLDIQSSISYSNCKIEDFLSQNSDIRLDLITGWSAFHHLLDINSFFENIMKNCNPSAIFISFDDLEYDKYTHFLRKFFLFVMPIRGCSYLQKLVMLFGKNRKKYYSRISIDSPAEIEAEKYTSGANQIFDFFYNYLDSVEVVYAGGFAEAVAYRLNVSSPEIRRIISISLYIFENCLMNLGAIKPRYRLLIGRKRK